MKTREELIKTPEYWFETIQNEIYRQLTEYMEANNISRTKLAEEMKVSKGYITQILNGDFNCSLRKLIELSLFIKKAPIIEFKSIDSVILEYNSKVVIPYSAINDKGFSLNATPTTEIANKSISIAFSTFSPVNNNDNKAA
jgi:transcriptional regulator with XRE-family HTH domain